MTKEEILKAIRVCARRLGRNPSLRELSMMAGVTARGVYTRIGALGKAFELAGLRAVGPGFSPGESTLLLDWARVARKLQKVPSVLEYQRAGRFSNKPFHTRYGQWSQVPEAFRKFVRKQGGEKQWRDVLKMIGTHNAGGLAKSPKGTEARAARAGKGSGSSTKLLPSQARAPAVHESDHELHQPLRAADEEPGHPDGEAKKEAACFCGLSQCVQVVHVHSLNCLVQRLELQAQLQA